MKQQEKLIMETVTDYVKQKEMAMSKAEEPADTVRLERPSDLERESLSALSNGEIVPFHTTGVGCDAEKIPPLNDALSDAENINLMLCGIIFLMQSQLKSLRTI